MTETTSAANKAKTTKHAASSFAMPDYGMPKFEMPKFGLPNTEMPAAFREMAEKGVEQTRDAYAKAKVASEEAIDLLENTYETAAKRATDYNHKLIEIVRTNTRAAFDNVHELLGAKSRRSFSSCRPRKCASNSRSCPGRTTSCARLLRRWRLRPLGQSRQARPRHLIRPADCAQGSGNFGPTTNSFRDTISFINPPDF